MGEEKHSAEVEWEAMMAAAKTERLRQSSDNNDSDSEHEEITDFSKNQIYPVLPQTKKIIFRKEGFLKKQGHFVKNWKQRFFVLEGVSVKYYENHECIEPKGSFQIEANSLVSSGYGGSDVCNHGYLFSVQISLEKQLKTWILASESDNERKKWISCISGVIEDISRPSFISPQLFSSPHSFSLTPTVSQSTNSTAISSFQLRSKEGYLYKLGNKVKSWRRRYFVASGDVMRYYKSQDYYIQELRPKGGFHLNPNWIVSKGFLEVDCNPKIGFLFTIGSKVNSGHRRWVLASETNEEREFWINFIKSSLDKK